MLVRPVAGYSDILPGEAFTGPDGSIVVGGRRAVNGTDVSGSRREGFALLSQARAFEESQYVLSLASDFFETSAVRTPADAGIASFRAGSSISLRGELLADAATGRGGALDISSANLRIVDAVTGADDAVELVAADLEALGAESILLGGTRIARVGEPMIEVAADTVELAAGVSLTGPDVILAARDTLAIGAGAELSVSDSEVTAERYRLESDAGVVRVSTDRDAALERGGEEGETGDVIIAEGARLVSNGRVAVDASRNVTSDGVFDIDGGVLRLGAAAIILGDGATTATGLQLDQEALQAINAAEIQLISRDVVTILGDVQLDVSERLILNAAGLTAAAGASRLSIAAPNVIFVGLDTDPSSVPVQVGSDFSVDATQFDFGGGNFALQGFEQNRIVANDSLLFASDGMLQADSDLQLASSLFTIAAGTDFAASSDGVLTLVNGSTTTPPLRTGGAGARLSLQGSSVILDSEIRAESGLVEISATDGDVVLAENALIDVSGAARQYDDLELATPGGGVWLDSNTGDLVLSEGSAIDVSAPLAAAAGRVHLQAVSGQIDAQAELRGDGATGDGAQLAVDANEFANLTELLDAADAGGFTGQVAVRQRGAAGLTIQSGSSIDANRVHLQSDQGSLTVAGNVRAGGDNGSIALHARDDVTIEGDLSLATNNGQIVVSSLTGEIAAASQSLIDLGTDGSLLVSLLRDQLTSLLDADAANDGLALHGDLAGNGAVTIEGRQHYLESDSSIDADNVTASMTNPWFAEADSFMQSAADIEAALGLGVGAVNILPGLVVETEGDLTVASSFNLFDWRFGDVPGYLSLRAGGDLLVDASINDGFATADESLLTYTGDSWSYRIVAGADFGAADLLGVSGNVDAGSLVIAPGQPGRGRTPPSLTLVRTGTGRIDVATAADIVFGSQQSVIYTSGIATDGVILPRRGDLGNRLYPDQGGDISLFAGRDILGAASDQLFTAWLWRTGRAASEQRPVATGWSISFANFEQNLAALGGGNVNVVANNNIVDFSASVPSIGRQIGGPTAEESVVEVVAGGDLRVRAGKDLLGGSYFTGLGNADIRVGGRFGSVPDGLAPILGLGDGRIVVTAQRDLEPANRGESDVAIAG